MKISPVLLCVFLWGAIPCQAQPKTPKLLGFNFSASYSKEKKATECEVGYKRIYPQGNEPVFDKTIIGKGGILTSETLSFLDGQGQIIGTLSSTFDSRGQLQSQSLKPAGRPARALNWFQTSAHSSEISVPGSVLRVHYILKNRAFNTRNVTLQTPDGPRNILSRFDAQGRRIRDLASSPKSPLELQFFYDAAGLVRFTVAATDTEKPKETLLRRLPDGQLSEMLVKEGGVLAMRMAMNPATNGSDGSDGGMRIESYEDGKLSHVAEFEGAKLGDMPKNVKQEQYAEGALIERKTLTMSATGEQQLRTVETFDRGKLQSRAEYDEKGALLKTTFFKADGSVERVETVGIPAPTTP